MSGSISDFPILDRNRTTQSFDSTAKTESFGIRQQKANLHRLPETASKIINLLYEWVSLLGSSLEIAFVSNPLQRFKYHSKKLGHVTDTDGQLKAKSTSAVNSRIKHNTKLPFFLLVPFYCFYKYIMWTLTFFYLPYLQVFVYSNNARKYILY